MQLRAIGLVFVVALAACSPMGKLASGSLAPGQRLLDTLNDDLADVLFAVDLPVSVEPIPPGPRFSYQVTGDKPQGLAAVLVPHDADDVMAVLPAPPEGRTYYVFAFAPADRPALEAIQAGARTQPLTPAIIVDLKPAVCLTAGADPARETLTVRPVLAGVALAPMLPGRKLNTLLDRAGASLPSCAGHSG